MKELTNLPPVCDKAWEHEGNIYVARKYDWWHNGTIQKKVIAFYQRPSGNRILVFEGHAWEKAISEFKKILKIK